MRAGYWRRSQIPRLALASRNRSRSTESGTSGPGSGSRRFLSAKLSPRRAAALVRRPRERRTAELDLASPFSVTLWMPERREDRLPASAIRALHRYCTDAFQSSLVHLSCLACVPTTGAQRACALRKDAI
jgi:hypothetical protein